MSTTSHERSFLLAHPPRRNAATTRPRRPESTTSASGTNQANVNGHDEPLDLLWDSSNDGADKSETKVKHHLAFQNSHQNQRDHLNIASVNSAIENEDPSYIDHDSSSLSGVLSTSVKQLQAREQVRQRVQYANNIRHDNYNRRDILLDDYDDDENDDVSFKPQEQQLLELEMTADATSATVPSSVLQGNSFPLDDLTDYVHPARRIDRIVGTRNKHENKTIPLHSTDGKNEDGQVGVYKNICSPPRPLQQPVHDAKRAISKLFGSSVVVYSPPVVQDSSNGSLRKTSLLDAVSSMDELRLDEVYGLEMSPSMNHKIAFQKENKSSSNGRQDTAQSHTEASWQHSNNSMIDIGDPFDYKPHPTSINRRSSSGPMSSRQSSKSNNENLDASSMAKKWFGKPLNYTTQPLHMPSMTAKDTTNDGSIRDDDWMDRLHQNVLEKNAHGKLSMTQMLGSNSSIKNHLNLLNLALFVSYGFTSAASSIPITLIPTIAMDILSRAIDSQGDEYLEQSPTVFASTVATYAVLGTALGKFLNGPMGDVFGARRVACVYALMLSLSLMALSFGRSGVGVILCCVSVEFFQSVQWPCIAVVLAAHYNNNSSDVKVVSSDDNGTSSPFSSDVSKSNDSGRYEKGIFIASLGSRCGSLLASLSTTILLRFHEDSWRIVARLASMSSFSGCLVFYMFVTDSPYKLHDPQNPIKDTIRQRTQISSVHNSFGRGRSLTMSQIKDNVLLYLQMAAQVFMQNIVPSLRSVLSNGTFWFVALAHSGGVMVCTSVRILGTYFRDTSYGVVSENEAGAVTMFLSVGILFGLAIGGNAFANLSSNAFARKKMISNLYILAVAMCYMLAFLAIPFVRKGLHSSTVVAFLQAASSFCMGASVAVQVYCIPAIVSCRFGANKGLYTSYTDGVACIVSSWVWKIVGGAVQEGNPQGAGWAYGWAAVALLVILAGVVMVQFVDYYFCRGGWRGEILYAGVKSSIDPEAVTGATNPNTSLADTSKRIWESRPTSFRPNFTLKRGQEMPSILSMEDDDDASTIVFEDITLPFDYSDIQSGNRDHEPEYLKSQLLDLLDLKGNDVCADCQAPYPRWVSIILPNQISLIRRGASKPLTHQIGCFCCTECAGSHRKLGNHIVVVRSVDYDEFKISEVQACRRGGNNRVNFIYEALLKDSSVKPSQSTSMAIRERFSVTKYEKKLWYKYTGEAGPQDKSFDNSLSLTSIELVESHRSVPSNAKNSPSHRNVYDHNAHDQYEAFIRSISDSDSEHSTRSSRKKRHSQDEIMSVSSEDSGDWHIETREMRGLDRLVNL
jgi:stromal membrane-associated protein